jgi:multidrug efflux pump subunit AcrA (membrane-fusion protein)
MPTRTRRRPVKPASKPRPRPSRRRPGALTALLVVVAAGAVVAAILNLKSSPAALVSERTVTVSKGVIQTVVSGSGNLAPANQADVDFATSGKVTKIYTKEGAHVSQGELLARIDDRSQKVDVAKAEAALVDAQDALTKAQAGEASGTSATVATTAGDTAASATTASGVTAGGARAVTAAYRAQETPTPTPTATAGPTETPHGDATPTPSAMPRATATPRASSTPAPTQSAPSAGGGARSGGGASSGAGGGSSGSSSSGASGGGSTQSVESAQAAVDSAQLALEDAQDALDDTELRAPMAGTVASISGAVGDTVGTASGGGAGDNASSSSGSSAFIVLAQLSRLKLEVGLSESDIGKVEVGQSATVTINAASGEDVAGTVTEVGVLASESSSGQTSSAVSYPVTITLDQSTDGVKAGMSATADIVVARASGISVPSQALRGSTVTVERNGKRSTVRVQTGVVGDSSTQVLSGLEAGDKVIVTSTSALSGRTASGQSQQQTGRLGGAGGFGGAGGGFGGGGGFRAGGAGFAVPPGGPGG